MTIKFVDGANVKVDSLCVVVYGAPNAGKTSLAFTAPKPIFLDFDRGSHRALLDYRSGKSVVAIDSWRDLERLSQSDVSDFESIVIDTAGRCLDHLALDIITRDPKMGRGGSLNLQGFGVLKSRFKSFLDQCRLWQKHVVLTAHLDESTKNDETIERIVAQGSSKNEIYMQADLMGRLYFDEEGKRILTFNPTSAAYGKNVGLDDRTFAQKDGACLSEVIREAKRIINNENDEDIVERERLDDLRATLEALEPKSRIFNEWLELMSKADAKPADRIMLVEIARSKDVEFDRDAKRFFVEGEADEDESQTQDETEAQSDEQQGTEDDIPF